MGAAAAPVPDYASVLVGREHEVERVDRFIVSAATDARAMVVLGEAGIGKTLLWRYAVARCREAGYQVLEARPSEEEMPLPGVGLVDLFEDTHVDVEALRLNRDPFQRGRAVLDAIRRFAATGPTILAIDDLQWVDALTARALRYAVRRVDTEPVGVFATARAPCTEPLATRDAYFPGRYEALELGPLSLGALRRLLRGTVEAISRPALAQIHALSGGNPLYAIELARGLPRGRRVTGHLQLPHSLQTAIEHHLREAPPEIAPLLEAVSALGAATVQALHDLVPDQDTEAALTTAIEQDLLVVEDDLSVRFAHPLVGSAVYARMTPLARRSLHARLAARATDRDARARHLALSTDAPDASVASLLEEAANRAAAQGAHTLASEFARHSLRITPAELEEDIRRRALLEVEHLAAAGEVRRALERADLLVATLPPGRARVDALMERAELEDDDRDAAEAYLLSALDEADGDDHLRGRVLFRLAQLRRLRVGDLPGAVDAAREALMLAERCGDARLELQSAAYLGHLETLAGEPRPDLVDRAARLETEVGTPPLSIGPRSLLALHRLWAGDLPAARSLLEALHAEAARTGNEMKQPQRLYILALVECAAGNLEAALERAQSGAEIALDAENTYAERELLYPLSLALAWLGREDEARESAERLRHEATTHGVQPLVARAASVIGLLALSVDDAEAAARELSKATELVEAMGFAHPGAFKVLPDTIEALARSGDAAAAAELLDVLERRAERTGAWAQAAAQRSRGAMMLSRGDPESAAEALAVAARMFDDLGHGTDAARALLARGRALVRAGQRAVAAEVAAEARDRFLRMGAAHWHARAAEVVERAAPGRAEGGLTPAESRIAGLVARGKRNREIGQELYMSVATVEAHLTRIYRKLAIRSRSELARLVAEGSIAVGAGRDG